MVTLTIPQFLKQFENQSDESISNFIERFKEEIRNKRGTASQGEIPRNERELEALEEFQAQRLTEPQPNNIVQTNQIGLKEIAIAGIIGALIFG